MRRRPVTGAPEADSAMGSSGGFPAAEAGRPGAVSVQGGAQRILHRLPFCGETRAGSALKGEGSAGFAGRGGTGRSPPERLPGAQGQGHGAPRFRRLSAWLTERYGERVFKVSLRGGFTCPNRDGSLGRAGCAFCAPRALEPSGYGAGQGLVQQLEAGMDYVRRRHGVARFIAYFQDYTATYAPLEKLREAYEVPLGHPEVVALALGTRPDCLGEGVLEFLEEVAARRDLWLEVGLQIADDAALERLGRGHGVSDFVEAARACQSRGLRVCAHVILGLPGVTEQTELVTAELLAELGIWGVKLHAFHVIEGSPVAAQHRIDALPLLSRKEHVARVLAFLERLPPGTVIHRVTGEAPPRLTLAPRWTVNKLAVFDAVVEAMEREDTWQGKSRGSPWPGLGVA